MHTWVAGKLALFMTLMFIVHADRLQEGVRLAQEREDDAERKNYIKFGLWEHILFNWDPIPDNLLHLTFKGVTPATDMLAKPSLYVAVRKKLIEAKQLVENLNI